MTQKPLSYEMSEIVGELDINTRSFGFLEIIQYKESIKKSYPESSVLYITGLLDAKYIWYLDPTYITEHLETDEIKIARMIYESVKLCDRDKIFLKMKWGF